MTTSIFVATASTSSLVICKLLQMFRAKHSRDMVRRRRGFAVSKNRYRALLVTLDRDYSETELVPLVRAIQSMVRDGRVDPQAVPEGMSPTRWLAQIEVIASAYEEIAALEAALPRNR